jgi:glycosyltransferase involved in cell wall biosynthesis
LNYGGAERQLVILAKGLRERGHDVVIALCYSGGPLEQELREAGVRIRPLHKRGRWDVLAFLCQLTQAVREERPAILHSYLTDQNLIAVLLKPLFPSIKIVWGVRCSMMDLNRYNWLPGLSLKLTCRLARFADAIIANSHCGREHHVALGYPAQKTVVISNGIDTKRFRPDPKARDRIRAEWGVTEHEKLIGLVGRLDPMKDHSNFLNAAALLVREGKQFRFVCVGDGPIEYRASLQKLARTLGLEEYIIWVSARADVSDIYSALDLLVSSSSFGEGFSNVIGEAMACGVPCVVTNVGDSAWVVGDQGKVVPPKNPVALRSAIQQVLNQKAYDPAQIRQRVSDQLSVNSLVTNTEQMLSTLLQGSMLNESATSRCTKDLQNGSCR